MKVKLVKESLDNRMSVEEFVDWFDNTLEAWYDTPDKELQFILSVLMNNEESTDEELISYLLDEIGEFSKGNVVVPRRFLEELVNKRDYFLDFTYAREIETF